MLTGENVKEKRFLSSSWRLRKPIILETLDLTLLMNLTHRYQKEIRNRGYESDSVQLSVIETLQNTFASIEKSSRKKTLLSRLLRGKKINREGADLGCYLWGGVGRGKSWLMDLFLSELNGYSHARMHYMEFMRQVHISLQQLRGQHDPLQIIAKRFADQWIGIDEFAVSDVADAMIWHELIIALRRQGAMLVITSNVEPTNLYQNGLQRERFLPAIEEIQSHMNVVHVTGTLDYRRRYLQKCKRYYYPADSQAENAMRHEFRDGMREVLSQGRSLLINRRNIHALQLSEDSAWFEFSELCHGPRSANDYIEIAKRFRNVFISKLPVFDEHMDDQAWRFIQLIDEFYDQRTKVYISAACEPDKLYRGRRFKNEFTRTISRLYAMQDASYGKLYA